MCNLPFYLFFFLYQREDLRGLENSPQRRCKSVKEFKILEKKSTFYVPKLRNILVIVLMRFMIWRSTYWLIFKIFVHIYSTLYSFFTCAYTITIFFTNFAGSWPSVFLNDCITTFLLIVPNIVLQQLYIIVHITQQNCSSIQW